MQSMLLVNIIWRHVSNHENNHLVQAITMVTSLALVDPYFHRPLQSPRTLHAMVHMGTFIIMLRSEIRDRQRIKLFKL